MVIRFRFVSVGQLACERGLARASALAYGEDVAQPKRKALVADLAVELTAALDQASGDEKKLLDTIFLFVQRAHAVDGATESLPEIVGISIARSSLLPGEREAVFRMFPRCDALGAADSVGSAPQNRWWRQRLAVRRTLDVGQHCI